MFDPTRIQMLTEQAFRRRCDKFEKALEGGTKQTRLGPALSENENMHKLHRASEPARIL